MPNARFQLKYIHLPTFQQIIVYYLWSKQRPLEHTHNLKRLLK